VVSGPRAAVCRLRLCTIPSTVGIEISAIDARPLPLAPGCAGHGLARRQERPRDLGIGDIGRHTAPVEEPPRHASNVRAVLMAVLVFAAAMNLKWAAAIAAVVFVQEVLPAGTASARMTGIALLTSAAVVAAG
jgi:hypothetical protein